MKKISAVVSHKGGALEVGRTAGKRTLASLGTSQDDFLSLSNRTSQEFKIVVCGVKDFDTAEFSRVYRSLGLHPEIYSDYSGNGASLAEISGSFWGSASNAQEKAARLATTLKTSVRLVSGGKEELVKPEQFELCGVCHKPLIQAKLGDQLVHACPDYLNGELEHTSKLISKRSLVKDAAGEMFQTDIEPGGEWYETGQSLLATAQEIVYSLQAAGVSATVGDVQTYDVYLGPYVDMTIEGIGFNYQKLFGGDDGDIYLELLPGKVLEGWDVEDIVTQILEILQTKSGRTKGAPNSWVADEDIWDKAKEAVGPDDGSHEDYYAVVTTVYKNMGGKVKSESARRAQDTGSYWLVPVEHDYKMGVESEDYIVQASDATTAQDQVVSLLQSDYPGGNWDGEQYLFGEEDEPQSWRFLDPVGPFASQEEAETKVRSNTYSSNVIYARADKNKRALDLGDRVRLITDYHGRIQDGNDAYTGGVPAGTEGVVYTYDRNTTTPGNPAYIMELDDGKEIRISETNVSAMLEKVGAKSGSTRPKRTVSKRAQDAGSYWLVPVEHDYKMGVESEDYIVKSTSAGLATTAVEVYLQDNYPGGDVWENAYMLEDDSDPENIEYWRFIYPPQRFDTEEEATAHVRPGTYSSNVIYARADKNKCADANRLDSVVQEVVSFIKSTHPDATVNVLPPDRAFGGDLAIYISVAPPGFVIPAGDPNATPYFVIVYGREDAATYQIYTSDNDGIDVSEDTTEGIPASIQSAIRSWNVKAGRKASSESLAPPAELDTADKSTSQTINGITWSWSDTLGKWVTIPGNDDRDARHKRANIIGTWGNGELTVLDRGYVGESLLGFYVVIEEELAHELGIVAGTGLEDEWMQLGTKLNAWFATRAEAMDVANALAGQAGISRMASKRGQGTSVLDTELDRALGLIDSAGLGDWIHNAWTSLPDDPNWNPETSTTAGYLTIDFLGDSEEYVRQATDLLRTNGFADVEIMPGGSWLFIKISKQAAARRNRTAVDDTLNWFRIKTTTDDGYNHIPETWVVRANSPNESLDLLQKYLTELRNLRFNTEQTIHGPANSWLTDTNNIFTFDDIEGPMPWDSAWDNETLGPVTGQIKRKASTFTYGPEESAQDDSIEYHVNLSGKYLLTGRPPTDLNELLSPELLARITHVETREVAYYEGSWWASDWWMNSSEAGRSEALRQLEGTPLDQLGKGAEFLCKMEWWAIETLVSRMAGGQQKGQELIVQYFKPATNPGETKQETSIELYLRIQGTTALGALISVLDSTAGWNYAEFRDSFEYIGSWYPSTNYSYPVDICQSTPMYARLAPMLESVYWVGGTQVKISSKTAQDDDPEQPDEEDIIFDGSDAYQGGKKIISQVDDIFKTTDGELFTDQDEAIEHQADVDGVDTYEAEPDVIDSIEAKVQEVNDVGYSLESTGKVFLKFEDAAKAWMQENGWYPNVWDMDDHGNGFIMSLGCKTSGNKKLPGKVASTTWGDGQIWVNDNSGSNFPPTEYAVILEQRGELTDDWNYVVEHFDLQLSGDGNAYRTFLSEEEAVQFAEDLAKNTGLVKDAKRHRGSGKKQAGAWSYEGEYEVLYDILNSRCGTAIATQIQSLEEGSFEKVNPNAIRAIKEEIVTLPDNIPGQQEIYELIIEYESGEWMNKE